MAALALAAALVLPSAPLHAQARGPAPALAPAAPVALPALGESASDDLRVSDERRLGLQIMRSVRGDPLYLDDPLLLAYVQSLWEPLVSSARRLGHIGADTDAAFGWEVFLVRDRAVNAFALPGGFVGVYLGLIALTESGDELASVLAHELTHVTQRHIARGLGNSQRVGMASMAAMLLALLAASQAGSPELAQAAIAGGQGAMIQGELNFSRDMEREADRIGFSMFEAAGFAPQGMASMFERLAFASRLSDTGAYPYLRSHPLTTERIAAARSRLPAAVAQASGAPLHALMRARARVLMARSSSDWQALLESTAAGAAGEGAAAAAAPRASGASAASAPPDALDGATGRAAGEALARTALRAMAAARLRDVERADAEAQALLRAAAAPTIDAAARQAAHRIAAEVWLAVDRADAAAGALGGAEADQGRPGLLLRSQLALLRARLQPGADGVAGARRSAEALQVWTAEHPDDAAAWQALAGVARAAGLPLRAQRADAEARAALGDIAGAVDGLRAARRMAAAPGTADAIEQQAVEARLRTLQQALDELRAQERDRR